MSWAGSGANSPLVSTLGPFDPAHSYIKARGITTRTAEFFGVGVFSGEGLLSGRAVIPIHNIRGEVVAYAGRALEGITEQKYLTVPPEFDKSLELYNLHRAVAARKQFQTKDVIVVEGFFDCMRVYQAGFHCVVSLIGTSMSEAQELLLVDNFERVLVMLDGDNEGWQATQNYISRLANQVFVKALVLPSGKQPDQLTEDEVRVIVTT